MAEQQLPFSKRQGHSSKIPEIRYRDEAGANLRWWVVRCAEKREVPVRSLRRMMCEALRAVPDDGNWSDYNIATECQQLINGCEWFKVYDIIEAIGEWLQRFKGEEGYHQFETEINAFLEEEGYGWKLENVMIVNRGDETFERTVHSAAETLDAEGKTTASAELHEAIAALSRRPSPDLTGAIHHATAAMECVARDVCGEQQPTFGKLLEKYPGMLPKPLDSGVEKIWGYASEWGRHLREGRTPTRSEAELVVGIAAAVSTYLVKKQGEGGAI